MQHVKKISVSIQFDEEEIELGELVSNDQSIYFKYYPSFIETGLQISPLKLKLNTEINVVNEKHFDGLFGVFADSLPDGWGRLLLDRALLAKGINLNHITALDRLAFVGSNAMGALVYKPEITSDETEFTIELDEIATASRQVIDGTPTDIIDELFKLGGSSGGARPKILVGYNPITQHLISDEKTLPADYEHWLIKFSSSHDSPDIANIEFAYHKMAIDAGIEMAHSTLFTGQSGQAYFGTKRFDRIENKRLHLHSAAGIMHDNFRFSTLDYGHLMDCAFLLEKDVKAYEKVFRMAAFNVFSHNRDDHSKNFSFLMDKDGNWKLAPAYDLTYSSSSFGFHSTMIAGESKNPGKKQLMELAHYFKLKNAPQIIEHVQDVIHNWKTYADSCGVSSLSKNKIAKTISAIK